MAFLRLTGIAIAIVLLVVLGGNFAFAAAPATVSASSAPASATGAAIPERTLREIEAPFSLAEQPGSQEEARRMLLEHMNKVLSLGQAALEKYPHASNRHLVLRFMLDAAVQIARVQGDEASLAKVVDLSGRIVDSDTPRPDKLQADFFITRQELIGPGKAQAPPAETTKAINAFMARYKGTTSEAKAIAMGSVLARMAGLDNLTASLLDTLQKDYASDEEILQFLRHSGRPMVVGKPFTAALTRLDGASLKLPDDLLGKVVVVDFWATWCGPCVAELPRMKTLYAKYQSKGVEFVGISLDPADSKAKVEKFVKDQDIRWIQTYSGKGWSDPTAVKNGVNSIPSVWVVGKDGKVVSDKARENLETVLDDALKAPASK